MWKWKLGGLTLFALSFWVNGHLLAQQAGGRGIGNAMFIGLVLILFPQTISDMSLAGARMSRPVDLPEGFFVFAGYVVTLMSFLPVLMS